MSRFPSLALFPRYRVSREVIALLLVCAADALSSAHLFQHGIAVEGNPVLRECASVGPLPFLLLKGLLSVPPLLLLEWLRRRNRPFITRVLRAALCGYLVVYAAGMAAQLPR